MSRHLLSIYRPLVALCNYTIFYAFCLESVYKLFRKNTLNKPAAGGTIGTENKREREPDKPQKGKRNRKDLQRLGNG